MSVPKRWICATHGYVECSRCEPPLAGLTREASLTNDVLRRSVLSEPRDTRSTLERAQAMADRLRGQREQQLAYGAGLDDRLDDQNADIPEAMSLEFLRELLARVIAQQPSCAENLNNLEARKILRITDIAKEVGVQAHKLRRFSRGEVRISIDLQRRLCWFFHRWDSGRTVKVIDIAGVNGKRRPGAVPGKGVLINHYQASVALERAPRPANQWRVEVTPGGPKLRLGKG
jgi:hypothetical protein